MSLALRTKGKKPANYHGDGNRTKKSEIQAELENIGEDKCRFPDGRRCRSRSHDSAILWTYDKGLPRQNYHPSTIVMRKFPNPQANQYDRFPFQWMYDDIYDRISGAKGSATILQCLPYIADRDALIAIQLFLDLKGVKYGDDILWSPSNKLNCRLGSAETLKELETIAKAAAFNTYKASKCKLLPPPIRPQQLLQPGSLAAFPQGFSYFNNLPLELRHMVWDWYLAAIPPRLVQLFFQRGLIKSTASSPLILFIHKESRKYLLNRLDWTQPFAWYDASKQDVKLAKQPVGRINCTAWFRPAVDQLYLGPRTWVFSDSTTILEKLITEDFACMASVQHLVVSRTDFESDRKLWYWFHYLVKFTAVETLTLVWDTEVTFLPHTAELMVIDEEDKADPTTKLLLKFKRRAELYWRREDALREAEALQNNVDAKAEGGEEEEVVLRSPNFQIKLGEVKKWVL